MENTKTKAFARFQRGYNYNLKLDYYAEVSENIDYNADKQWGSKLGEGSTPTPVFNVEKMIFRYKTSSIISPSVKAKYLIDAVDEEAIDEDNKALADMAKLLSDSASVRWERNKMISVLRKCVEDSWLTGDMCTHTYWDHGKKTNQELKGDFITERISGGNVFFGNPKLNTVKGQPYILILKPETVSSVKKRAKAFGLSKDKIDKIVSNENTDIQLGQLKNIGADNVDDDDSIVDTYLTYYIEDDVVYLDEETPLVHLKMKSKIKEGGYPITWGNWETQENSYHGRPESSGLHTTQRFINKMYALCMLWMINNAFGKIVYDENRCEGITNDVGVAQPVNGAVSDVIMQLRSGDFNSAILSVIDNAINTTLRFCGVTEAALGAGTSYNTSAQITNIKQSSILLKGNQDRTFQFVEDIYAIWGDFIVEKYGDGRLMPVKENGKVIYKKFDASLRKKMILNTKIEVGYSPIWDAQESRILLTEMLQNSVLTPIQFLDQLDDGMLKDKEGLIAELKAMASMPEPQPQGNMLTEADNEQMAAFFDSLPVEQQTALKSLPADQMEQQVIQMMSQPQEQQPTQ